MRAQPIRFIWRYVDVADADGVVELKLAMVPANEKYAAVAIKQFGEENTEHVLAPIEERNMRFHAWFFATFYDAWLNLPEKIAARWDDDEHFRKWLLCNKTEFYDEKEIERATEQEAIAVAVGVRTGSRYASIYGPRRTNTGCWKVIVRVPHSQAVGAMGVKAFEESAKQVLDAAGEFLGVPRGELIKNARRVA